MTMYAIISKNTSFVMNGTRKPMLVQKYSFTELGLRVVYTKVISKAKLYKTFTMAAKASHNLGPVYDVIKV